METVRVKNPLYKKTIGKSKENTTTGEAYETASLAIGSSKQKKIKVLIEIHQNTKLKGGQFHVVYKGNNYEIISTSEKEETIANCKKNIKAHSKLFADGFKSVSELMLLTREIAVNVYQDKKLQKTIFVKL